MISSIMPGSPQKNLCAGKSVTQKGKNTEAKTEESLRGIKGKMLKLDTWVGQGTHYKSQALGFVSMQLEGKENGQLHGHV